MKVNTSSSIIETDSSFNDKSVDESISTTEKLETPPAPESNEIKKKTTKSSIEDASTATPQKINEERKFSNTDETTKLDLNDAADTGHGQLGATG